MQTQIQRPATRPITTAHLAQTMALMGLNAWELRAKIESSLAENPALELIEERYCPTCHRPLVHAGPCPVCSRPQDISADQTIVFVSPREDFYNPQRKIAPEDIPDEEIGSQKDELPLYVFRQIAPELKVEERSLAAFILNSLDEDGLLRVPLVEIARYHHILPSKISEVLKLIQRADPVGVGSPSPQEALLVQIEVLSESRPIPELASAAIQKGMDLLSHHKYVELGRLLGISTAQAKEIAGFISDNLNPYPARAYWGDTHNPGEDEPDVYHIPDVIISRLHKSPDTPLVVEVISPLAGKLRINPLFREALQQAPDDKADQWHKSMEQASLLIKCIQQRNHTIVRLMRSLVRLQRDFILHGNAHLKPITRASLAGDLDVHESTISRAVSNKAVQLPNGRIIPLSQFFDRSLHIRTAMKEIIAEENKPLTDTQIAILLKKQGHVIARRTVAKYRAMEGILPAHLRVQTR